MDWTTKSDKDVFSRAGEQQGSQAGYQREIEIKRRLYTLEKESLELQSKLLNAQIQAVNEQRVVAVQMKKQSHYMLLSVVGIFLTALATLVTVLI